VLGRSRSQVGPRTEVAIQAKVMDVRTRYDAVLHAPQRVLQRDERCKQIIGLRTERLGEELNCQGSRHRGQFPN
jgi:hypothetical protein